MGDGDFENDKDLLNYVSENEATIQSSIVDTKKAAIKAKILELEATL